MFDAAQDGPVARKDETPTISEAGPAVHPVSLRERGAQRCCCGRSGTGEKRQEAASLPERSATPSDPRFLRSVAKNTSASYPLCARQRSWMLAIVALPPTA